MLALIVVLGLITGGLSSILCPTKVDPQRTVHLPHPTSCSKFLTCVGSYPVEQDCPAGLHWNVEKTFCDYPGASECSRGEDSDQLQQRPFNLTAVANSICLPQTSRCPLNSNPSEDVIFLKHRDCRKFYACVSTQQVELSCPPELYWNSRACVCDYEVEAECEGVNGLPEGVPEVVDEEPTDAEEHEPNQEIVDEEPELSFDELPEVVDEEHFEPKDVEEHEPIENNQPIADEEPELSFNDVPEVRVRRAADGDSSSGSSATNSSSGTSGSGSSTSGSTGSGSSSSGSSSSGSSSSGTSGSSSSSAGSKTVQPGANIRTFSAIAMIVFTAAMSVL